MKTSIFQNGKTIPFGQTWILIVFFLFTCFRLPYFLSDAFVTDEFWHMLYMNDHKSMRAILNMRNYMGHGVGFWRFGAIIFAIFDFHTAPFVLRFLSFLSLLFSAVFLYRLGTSNDNPHAGLITTAWLSTPVAWWGGKMVFPESYSLFFLSLIAYLLFSGAAKERKWLQGVVWTLAGFTIGMKVSAIPAVFFLGLFYLYSHWLSWKQCLKSSLIIICFISIGFLICNPCILHNLHGFIAYMKANGKYGLMPMHILIGHYEQILLGEYIEWDMVSNNGINEDVVPLLSLFMAFIYLFNDKRGWVLASLVLASYICVMAIFSLNKIWYPWHTFQSAIIPFIAMALTRDKDTDNFKARWQYVLLGMIILTNLHAAIPNTMRDIEWRREYPEFRRPWPTAPVHLSPEIIWQ